MSINNNRPGGTQGFITPTGQEILQNKDIDGGLASNTSRFTIPKGAKSALDALTRKEGTILYATDLQKLFEDNGSVLAPIGSGSGTKNYVSNPDDASAGWVASGAGVTVATTSTSANLPENITKLTAIDILRVSGSTDYVRTRFTLDVADYNKRMGILWDQIFSGSNGDYVLELWSNTASNYGGSYTQLALTASSILSGNGSFISSFDSPGSGAQYLELRIRVNSGTSHLYLSGATVTPGSINQAPAVSYLGQLSFVPSAAWSSQSAPRFDAWRVGNVMRVRGRWSYNGVTGTTMSLALPGGYTIDSSEISSNSNGQDVGTWINNTQGSNQTLNAGLSTNAILFYDGSDTGNIYLAFNVGATGYNKSGASGVLSNTTSTMNVEFDIPISQWAGAGTLNTLIQDNLTDWIQYTPDPTGSGFGTPTSPSFFYRRVGDSIEIQGNFVTGTVTGSSATIALPAGLTIDFTKIGNDQIVGALQRNASANPYWAILNSSDTGKLYFAASATPFSFVIGTAFGGSEYETFFTTRIPIVQWANTQSSLVGFTQVSQNFSGLVQKAGQLLGTNTNDTAAAGYVGELLTGTTPAGNATPNSTENVCQVTLTAGCWDVRGAAGIVRNAAGTLTIDWVYASISTVSATQGTNATIIDQANVADQRTLAAPPLRVNVPAGSTQIVYAVLFSNFTGTTAAKTGYIEAVRVR